MPHETESPIDTKALPLLPLHDGVVLPDMVVTLTLVSEDAQNAVDSALDAEGQVLLVPIIDGTYATVGVVAELESVERTRGGGRAAVVRSTERALVGTGTTGLGLATWVEATLVVEPEHFEEYVTDLAAEYRAVVSAVLEHRGARGAAQRLVRVDHPGQLADLAIYSPDLSVEQKAELLETLDVEERLRLALGWMNTILADLNLREKVQKDAAERVDKSQREYLLRQQMQAIKAELGDDDDTDDYRTRIAEADLPEHVREAAEKEVDRLEGLGTQSPEQSWIRTWLDTILDIPWATTTEDRLNLERARSVLDADHHALEDVKERLVEYLALRKLRVDRNVETDESNRRRGEGEILLLVGPPGVGKTSLGESVASALGRKFVRVALGGVRDEAEVRGHRRTYVGARPGRIVRALIDAGTMNPVFLLDELDKVGSDWRGDPSSALLEVLDPAQNHTFRDHYLELDMDLSQVIFVATANVLETIPAPLLDRTEIIRIDGYTDDEKVSIARDHLLPRQMGRAGLEDEELIVSDEVLAEVVTRYTREAGVRGLERQLGKLVRKVAVQFAEENAPAAVTVEADALRDLLGKPPVSYDTIADRTSVPGVSTGLAVTGFGGDVLFIEVSASEGEPGMVITGQLGDVMKESAQIALSYVKANAERLGIDPAVLERRFHLHVPAGAIPKDGPSAGVALVTALVSLLTGKTVDESLGMTGEVTLQGRVLPIGGVKQKVLAAHRAGLRKVIVPAKNSQDLDDVPDQVREEIEFFTPTEVSEVLDVAFA